MAATTSSTTFTWDLPDLIPTSSWFYDSSTAIPDIVGMGGFVSSLNGLVAAGTGYMSSSFGSVSQPPFGNGDWTFAGPSTAGPVPSIMLLLGTGFVGLVGFGRKNSLRKFSKITKIYEG